LALFRSRIALGIKNRLKPLVRILGTKNIDLPILKQGFKDLDV